ncbi:MAG TPA: hypothetical protein VHZ03_02005 [Trebonia sp.]|nr:hypothetical protein [Trebonia sp.]
MALRGEGLGAIEFSDEYMIAAVTTSPFLSNEADDPDGERRTAP